ncbi:hypothetical protein [Nocardia spumae]|uniref:hypothetical protein n=1 Tax=Nocardia spumae TaxID=2887190 RepID=UPI001D147B86|nr:hypothetical protein [Nocardia spumae]
MFTWYVALLAVSGIIMIALASVRNGQSSASRSLNGVLGAVYLGYAAYLAFLFDGGSYLIFFQAFIVPVVMVVNFFRNRAPRPKLTETQKAWREYQRASRPSWERRGGAARSSVRSRSPIIETSVGAASLRGKVRR